MTDINAQHSEGPLQGVGALILAAGKGTRMYSDTPKVLQRILEEPMLGYVYAAVQPVCPRVFTVVGHGADMVRSAFPDQEKDFVLQEQQLGTGHALQTAWSAVAASGVTHVLVINGDTPLIREETLRSFVADALAENADIAFITLTLADPAAFGRVVRKNGDAAAPVLAIVEAKDFDAQKYGPEPKEINAGIYCLKLSAVEPLLPLLSNANKSGEFYITDLVGLGVARGLRVTGHDKGNDPTMLGINSPAELVRSEEYIRGQIVDAYLNDGVIIRAPGSVRIGPKTRIGRGVEITGPCEVYGESRIGSGARIASHCRIMNAAIAEGVTMHSYCHVENSVVAKGCIVGPYARLRPGAILDEGAHVGNFVEMKKARLGKGSKANHLTYLGDAEVGEGVNIGAGTITCNYDGKNKFTTTIHDGAFIGSNSSLVAPVEIGADSLVGAGSVITKDLPEGHLGLTRAPQKMMPYVKK